MYSWNVILPVSEPPRSLFWGASFIGSLYSVVREDIGAEVDLGPRHFWNPRPGVDAILVQWPEALFEWREVQASDLLKLWETVTQWKDFGTKIISFRHNIRPHLLESRHYIEVYEGLLERSDAVVHLGQYSRDECPKYDGVVHRVISHPRYVQQLPDASEAKKRLGLKKDGPVLLIYGSVRHKQEMALIRRACRLLAKEFNGQVLFGTFPIHLLPVKRGGRFLMPIISKFWKLRYNAILHQGQLHGLVEDDFLAAADFILVPRLNEHLNSGVLVKALSLGITPIATSVGNLAQIGHAFRLPMLDDSSVLGLRYIFNHSVNKRQSQDSDWKEQTTASWGREAIADPLMNLFIELLDSTNRGEEKQVDDVSLKVQPTSSRRSRNWGVIRRLPKHAR